MIDELKDLGLNGEKLRQNVFTMIENGYRYTDIYEHVELTKDQIKEIAEIKLPDLNCYDIEAAMKIVEGTARNMGIAVEGVNDKELAEQQAEAKAEEIKEAKREAELAKMEAEANEVHEVEVIGEDKENEE